VEFEHVLVVGAGQMGGGIAQVAAAAGCGVSLHDAAPGATDRALETIRRSAAKLAEKGGPDPDEVLGRIEPVDDLVPADLMVEAVVEDLSVKEDIFRRADATLPGEAVLASNTSSIPIGSLAAVTGRPDKVIGMHFFNPVPVLKLVEVIRGRETSDETARSVVAFAEELGKVPAQANDFPGFVSNRILMPFINEAAYALMEGVAEAEAIEGAELFAVSGCLQCHTYLGSGSSNLGAPDLTDIGAQPGKNVDYLTRYISDPSKFGNNVMPQFEQLGEENLQKLAAFLVASKGSQ
jgi:3-hydroxybutyryl-CoA dehydrogenase